MMKGGWGPFIRNYNPTKFGGHWSCESGYEAFT